VELGSQANALPRPVQMLGPVPALDEGVSEGGSKHRPGPARQSTIDAWMASWHKGLKSLKEAAVSEECSSDDPQRPKGIAKSKKCGCPGIRNGMLDTAGQPRPDLHLLRN
jgi:hypothetical protein